MRLYMKQKVFSLKQKTSVYDENQNELYYIEAKVISVGRKMTLYDNNMNELAFIRQKAVSFLPKFFVEINGEVVCTIVKKFTFLKQKYEIQGKDWQIEGDFMAHDYNIVSGSRIVATIHKKWLSWGDAYEIDIDDGEDVVTALATVLAIDAVLDQNSSSSASFSFSGGN